MLENISYEEFLEITQKDVSSILKERYDNKFVVKFEKFCDNPEKHSLTIEPVDGKKDIIPRLDLRNSYDKLKKLPGEYAGILDKQSSVYYFDIMVNDYMKHFEEASKLNSDLSAYGNTDINTKDAEGHLFCVVQPKSELPELVKDGPYMELEKNGRYVTYYWNGYNFDYTEENHCIALILITDKEKEKIDLPILTLHEYAVANTKKIMCPNICNMLEAFGTMLMQNPESTRAMTLVKMFYQTITEKYSNIDEMFHFLVTNSIQDIDGIQTVLLSQEYREEIADELDDSYVIIPCTKTLAMLIPETVMLSNGDEANKIFTSVTTFVLNIAKQYYYFNSSPIDQVSYFYDRTSKSLIDAREHALEVKEEE